MESSSSRFFLFFLTSLYIVSSNATPSFPKEALPTKTGYLPINSTSNSSIYFAYYEAQNPISPLPQTPLLIWLQGGPGCSSMIGNFNELGPWRVTSDLNQDQLPILKPNHGAWNNLFGLLFIDNPIGVGFSIASTPDEIPRDQETVGKHLFAAIQLFIASDSLFKLRPIYITGESYAGKYVPGIGYYILQNNAQLKRSQQVNLKGVAIGNGLTDPITQVTTHAVTAYYLGLINNKQMNQLEKLQSKAVELTKQGKWSNATDARNTVLDTLQNITGLLSLYDWRISKTSSTNDTLTPFLNQVEIKKVLGVPSTITWEGCSDIVGDALHADVMKSVKYMVEELVKKTKVLLYQGQFDLQDGVVTTEAWIKTMKWEGLDKFLDADRVVWEVNDEVAGYVQKWGNLSEVVVSGAGHFVPTDQAVRSQAMIQDWVLDRGLFGNNNKNS